MPARRREVRRGENQEVQGLLERRTRHYATQTPASLAYLADLSSTRPTDMDAIPGLSLSGSASLGVGDEREREKKPRQEGLWGWDEILRFAR